MGRWFAVMGAALSLSCAWAFGGSLKAALEPTSAGSGEGALQTWWHWTSQYVTRAGITADLEAMRAIGYDVAHIFCAAMSSVPPGKESESPRMLSPEWLGLYRHACEEAKRLGLRLGVHNCPGWSSSGGPWIRPEDSMKFVVSTETPVVGGGRVSVSLERPEARRGFYRDIAVLAVPDFVPDGRPVAVTLASGGAVSDGGAVVDGRRETSVRLPIREVGASASVTLRYGRPRRPRAVLVSFDETHGYVDCRLEASADGETFVPVRTMRYRLFRDAKGAKLSRVRLSEPAVAFRLTFVSQPAPGYVGQRDMRLAEVSFLDTEVVEDIGARNSLGTSMGYAHPRGTEAEQGIGRSQVIDLTGRMGADGRLEWAEAPEGRWRLLRIGYTTTGVTCAPAYLSGLECDKLSRRGLDAHWPHFMGVLLRGQRDLGVLKYATIDSYEVNGQNWTEGFEEAFRRRRGYGMRPFLPAMLGYVVGTRLETHRFLYDLQRTVSDLFAENYYDYFAELCHREGLTAITEPYGGPFDQLRCARRADIPSGEFWLGQGRMSLMPGSAAHVHGALGVGAEAFTTDALPGRWQGHPEELKVYGDRGWLMGVSRLIVHSYVHQPLVNVRPGMSLGHHGSQLNRNTTWWPLGRGWADYVRRAQRLLQAGVVRNQALVLSGESNPNRFPTLSELTRAGYGYDYVCADDLRDSLEVLPDGRLRTPSGAVYDLLHLGTDRFLTVATLRRVRELAEAGARVSGLPPEGSPSLSDTEEAFASAREALWGDSRPGERRRLGRGWLCHAARALEALRALGVRPSVTDNGGLEVVRRQVGDSEAFLVCNDADGHWLREVGFVVAEGLEPRLYRAEDGRVEEVASWRREGDATRVLLSLGPYESALVVFGRGASSRAARSLRVVSDTGTKGASSGPRLRVCRAVYRRRGAEAGEDVTAQVASRVTDDGLELKVTNELVGHDPAPNQFKELLLEYELDGEAKRVVWPEHTVRRIGLELSRRPAPFQVVSVAGEPRLQFRRQASVEVIARDGTRRTVTPPKAPSARDISDGWDIRFPADTGAPERVRLARLGSLSEHADECVRYAAGLVTYGRRVEAPMASPDTAVILDLGDVRHVAEVMVNGELAGLLWHRPYRVDITRFCRGGAPLDIRVRVALLWPNRMIGDARLRQTVREPGHPAWPDWVLADRSDSGLGIRTFSNFRTGWKATDSLLLSGLIGPARLLLEPQAGF